MATCRLVVASDSPVIRSRRGSNAKETKRDRKKEGEKGTREMETNADRTLRKLNGAGSLFSFLHLFPFTRSRAELPNVSPLTRDSKASLA